jgi:hypothetical protein
MSQVTGNLVFIAMLWLAALVAYGVVAGLDNASRYPAPTPGVWYKSIPFWITVLAILGAIGEVIWHY